MKWGPSSSPFGLPSFSELLRERYPDLHPQAGIVRMGDEKSGHPIEVPHGTTILSFRTATGVIIAGDRMATEGYQVADRRIDKVYETDSHSAMAIAGAAGPAIEMARLFKVEIEHYEKIEGERLGLVGKANRLGAMIRQNLPLAMQGLVVVPIFAGYDVAAKRGRIFKYDVTGGRYEDTEFYSTGSGGKDARGTLKRLYRRDLSDADGVRLAVEALFDAADEDRATGGPDVMRGIFPTVKVITAEGIRDVSEDEVKQAVETVIAHRKERGVA